MSGKPATPEQQAEILAMTEAGYSVAVIVSKTGLSASTVSRIRSKGGVKKGTASGELVEQARRSLYDAFREDLGIKNMMTGILADNAAIASLIREKTLLTIEHLSPTDNQSAAIALRSLTAASTLLKNTTDSIRVLMPDLTPDDKELPTITIRRITDKEVSSIREQQRRENDIVLGLDPYDRSEEQNDIIDSQMTGT